MIKIAIIDDNRFYIDDVKRLLAKNIDISACEIYEFCNAQSFLNEIDKIKFDIVFLDIILGGNSGIELGGEINKKQPDAAIIFVSAHAEYFKDVYRVTHSYFLTKEFEEERFSEAIGKVLKDIKKNIISVKVKNTQLEIVLDDVIYLEGYLKRTTLYMTNGESVEYNINIRELEPLLPQNMFVRTHQSFVVNMQHIKNYSRQEICADFNYKIPISRTYINPVREKITLFLGGAL